MKSIQMAALRGVGNMRIFIAILYAFSSFVRRFSAVFSFFNLLYWVLFGYVINLMAGLLLLGLFFEERARRLC